MVKDEVARVLRLQATLDARVIGQRRVLAAIAQRIQTARTRLVDPDKQVGVFVLVGPSVGKTETALALAEAVHGGEQNLITINMSEFQEPHTVSTLKGSPPGYVGYGEGGVLTEAVRRRPYSVILLDEVEEARGRQPHCLPGTNLPTRDDVLNTIRIARERLERHEPSNPVAVLLKRAGRMVCKRLSQVADAIPLVLWPKWDSAGEASR
jgi:hypothetical protein